MRDVLSAASDAEAQPAEAERATEHLAGCGPCREFAARLEVLNGVTAASRAAAPAAPDLAAMATARWQRRRDSRMYILRWAVGLMGGAELANALLQLVLHGTSEAHATHESLSFAIAISLALVCASLRPALATGYLPVVGTAVGLLMATAVFDIASGRITWYDEVPHVDLLIGCVLMWILSREQGTGPGAVGRGWRPLLPSGHGRFRIVPAAGGLARLGLARLSLARLGKVGLGTALASAIVLTPGAASAHAVLDSSDPAPNSIVTSAPASISLGFSESVTLPTGGVQVFAPNGARADGTGAAVAGSRLTVPLTASEQGTYLVSYRVVSADSHPITGAFTYSVGHVTTAPSAPKAADDTSLSTALGVSRFVGYAGAAALIGGVALWLLGWSPTRTGRRVVLVGAGALAAAGVAGVLIKGPLDAGLGWGSVGQGSLLADVLATTYGRAELTRVVLAILAGVIVAARGRLGAREFAGVVTVVAVLISLSFALAGHASAGTAPGMSVLSWTIHALAMALWVGGLMHLVVDRVWRSPGAVLVLRRFSTLALCSVAALVVSGLFQSWRQVRSWGALFDTPYGRVLMIKVLLVAVIVVMGYGSRYLLRTAGSAIALGRTVLLEVGGVAVVLAVTAGLVATEPAATSYRPSTSASLAVAGARVKVEAVPQGVREVALTLQVVDAAGELVDPEEVKAEFTLPATGTTAAIGPLAVDLEDVWTGERSALVSVPVAGQWRLAVTVRVSDFEEGTETLTVPIR